MKFVTTMLMVVLSHAAYSKINFPWDTVPEWHEMFALGRCAFWGAAAIYVGRIAP